MRENDTNRGSSARLRAVLLAWVAASKVASLAAGVALAVAALAGGIAGCGDDPAERLQPAPDAQDAAAQEQPGIFFTVGGRTLNADTAVSQAGSTWLEDGSAFTTQIIAGWTHVEGDDVDFGVIRAAIVLVGGEEAGVRPGAYTIDLDASDMDAESQTGSLVLSDLGLGLPETLTARSGRIVLEALERDEESRLARLLLTFEGIFTDPEESEHEVRGTIRFMPRQQQ